MSMPIPTKQKEDSFWQWFEKKSSDLRPRNLSESPQLQRALDMKMNELDVPGWEIGPFSEEPKLSFLAFSPMGDREKFKLTRKMADRAPEIPGWIFLAAKPAKKWDRLFEWRGRTIDASNWKLIVYSFEDGLCDFVFIDEALDEISKDKMMSVLVFLVGSELGELELMQRVNALEYDASPTVEMRESAIALHELKEVLEAI